jgi:hypothetical protein
MAVPESRQYYLCLYYRKCLPTYALLRWSRRAARAAHMRRSNTLCYPEMIVSGAGLLYECVLANALLRETRIRHSYQYSYLTGIPTVPIRYRLQKRYTYGPQAWSRRESCALATILRRALPFFRLARLLRTACVNGANRLWVLTSLVPI